MHDSKYSVTFAFSIITITTSVIIAAAIANIIIIRTIQSFYIGFIYQNCCNPVVMWHICTLRTHCAYVISILETV